MAELNSWPGIRQIGLRTTEQLVDACQPDSATRAEILEQRRKRSYELTHPIIGTVVVRDQKPLLLHNLEPALTDVTVEEFLALLNTRVFMWAHPSRLDTLLGAAAYSDSIHDVLVFDTARIVEAYSEKIRLTGMNSGASIFPSAPKRGSATFMTLAEFPFDERRRAGKGLRDNVVELCVLGGVDNVEEFVLRVERRKGPDVFEVIHQA